MQFTTNVDREKRLRTHELTGVVSPKELSDALHDVFERPDFQPDGDVLCDMRQAELGELSRDTIKGIAQFISARRGESPGARTAIVVGRDLGFGLARMYEQLVESESSINVSVFRDIEEARAWLAETPTE